MELDYAAPVQPAVVLVHATYNPGAIYKVTAYSQSAKETVLWSGKDPIDPSQPRGVAELTGKTNFKTQRIRIHLKSKEVTGWNEIDAVGIKDADGKLHWAVRARASSTYASRG